MSLVKVLFSFQGRISRSQYWLGSTLASVANFLTFFIMGFANAGAALGKDPSAMLGAALASAAITIPINIAVVWCSLAVQVKRFHDRGRTGWLAAVPFALVLWMIVSFLGSAFANAPIGQAFSSLGLPFALLMVVCLAFFVDLGLMPSKGPNQYGDGPGSAPAPPVPGLNPLRPQNAAAHNAKAAANSLLSAEAAMERAISERPAARPQQTAPAPRATLTPSPATPMGPSGGGFGRRAR